MEINETELITAVDSISDTISKELLKELDMSLNKCGLFYKSFGRIKKSVSVLKKIKGKMQQRGNDYKMQDLIGIRITVYFKNDIELCENIISSKYDVVDISKDKEEAEVFRPQRINYVCKLPTRILELFDDKLWNYPIDQTFEIQLRTVFSEGWHEVEHDFRYKCKSEWEEFPHFSRMLNGILATLENCDWAISNLFNEIAYQNYKKQKWIPMLKNTLLIRVENTNDLNDILKLFDEDQELAKQFYRLNRNELLLKMAKVSKPIPLTMKNLIFIANYYQIQDDQIDRMMSNSLKDLLRSE